MDDGDEIYDDIYESLGAEKQHLVTLLKSHGEANTGRLDNLRADNNNKMNKLKLLLYQKFINILFSVIGLNLRYGFKEFYENCKIMKLKCKGFKLDTKEGKVI
jgi:hypothetical protein